MSRRARLGAWLFRARSWVPLPLVVALLLTPTSPTVVTLIVGTLVAFGGSCVRAAAVAAAGVGTRRRSRNVATLVTHGAFAWVRNPIYLGNLLLWIGVVVCAGAWTLAPWAAATFAILYSLIVAYEESVLESSFGAAYREYVSRVPRWIPRRPPTPVAGAFDWPSAWRKEWHSGAAVVVISAAIVVKKMFG